LHLAQHVPQALKHILWRDAFAHLLSQAALQSASRQRNNQDQQVMLKGKGIKPFINRNNSNDKYK